MTTKNTDYVGALAALGFTLPPDFNTQGKQHGEFQDRVIQYLASGGQGTPSDDQIRAATDLWNKIDSKLHSSDGASWSDVLDPVGHFFGAVGGAVGGKLAQVGGAVGQDVGQVLSSLASAPGTLYSGLQGSGGTPDYTKLPSYKGSQPGAPPPGPGSPNQSIPTAHPASGEPKGVPLPGLPAPGTAKPGAAGGAGGAAGAGAGAGGRNDKVTVDNPANWSDDKVKTWLKQNLGSDAFFVDIPEVWDVMSRAVRAGKDVGTVDGDFMKTAFYQNTSAKARLWYQQERADPASARADIAQQAQAVGKLALDQGITIDPTRAAQIAESYLRYGWSQADLSKAIGAEWHYDPSSKQQAAIVGTLKDTAKNWLVPLSDQAIQTWGSGILEGTSTQDQFDQYLREQAKSLLPQLATLIDQHQGDAQFNVGTFVDPYKQQAANLLGLQPDQIDFNDPKWRKALDTVDPATGQRRIMSLSEWSSTLKTDSSYGYDKTQRGVQDGLDLANQLKTSLGF